MTVQELIERLQDFDPEAEVRLLTQMHWPFQNEILGLCENRDLNESQNDCGCGKDDCPDCNPDEEGKIVFIVEGEQLGYGNKKAWEVAG
jgi:hypothetical protein